VEQPGLLFKKLISVSVLLLVAGLCALAQEQSHALAGKWKMVSEAPDGSEVAWTLVINYADGKYSGTLETGQGSVEAKNFRAEGNDVSLTAPYEGNDYEIKLHLTDGKLKGTWSGNGDSGDTRGEKASTAS
jgi:hypothetical protein